MNSLVVFLSVVALAAAKPSGLIGAPLAYSSQIIAGPTAYAAPAIATIGASAVSSQSRLDIKSSPAVASTAAIAPITRTVISEPALVATPAIATAAIAPAAVSSQSRIDIKSTPAISSTVLSSPIGYGAHLAYTAGAPLAYSAGAPLAYAAGAPLAYAAGAPLTYAAGASRAYNTPILAGAVAPTILNTAYGASSLIKTSYAGTIAAPAAIAGSAVPLDTPEVIAARAAHFEAKGLAGAHLIKKRSAPLIASSLVSTPVISTYGATPLISTVHTSPLTYSTPLALSTPLITKTYSVHSW